MAFTLADSLTRLGLSLLGPILNPNAAFAEVYWVDADSGSDSNDGLSPEHAFQTMAAAITANNTAFSADGDTQRTMYVHSKTYTQNLSAFPRNCTVIGIGGKVRIQGYHDIGTAQNCHFHNIQFRSSQASEPIINAQGNSHGLGFHNCVFDSQAAISECLKFTGSSSDMEIENCRIGYDSNPTYSPDIAIRFAGSAAQRGKIVNNQIWSTGIGIQIDIAMVSSNVLLIKDNVISSGPGSADVQMDIGIYDKTGSPNGALYVNNWISAVDAIKFDVANTKSQNMCIGNHVVQAGTGGIETSGS
jgi:hypothetical protein